MIIKENITIKTAEPQDLDSLFELVSYWDRNEYHFKYPYTYEVLQNLVDQGFVAVAVDKEAVVSNYLVNPIHDVGTLADRKKIISELMGKGKIPKGKYAYTLLSGTHQNYFNQGLNRRTLDHLRKIAGTEYDFFTGWPYHNNKATIESSLKMGWKYFGDAGFGLIAITGTTEENNDLLDKHLVK